MFCLLFFLYRNSMTPGTPLELRASLSSCPNWTQSELSALIPPVINAPGLEGLCPSSGFLAFLQDIRPPLYFFVWPHKGNSKSTFSYLDYFCFGKRNVAIRANSGKVNGVVLCSLVGETKCVEVWTRRKDFYAFSKDFSTCGV